MHSIEYFPSKGSTNSLTSEYDVQLKFNILEMNLETFVYFLHGSALYIFGNWKNSFKILCLFCLDSFLSYSGGLFHSSG